MKTSQTGEITRTGRKTLRASTIYNVFVGGVMLSSFLAVMLVQVISTASGLNGGSYGLIIQTNSLGENYMELALEVAALPGAIYFFMSLKSLVGGGPEAKTREDTNPVREVPLYFGNLRWNPPRKASSLHPTNGGLKPAKVKITNATRETQD